MLAPLLAVGALASAVASASSSSAPTAANPFAHYTTTTYLFWYLFYALLFLLFYIFSSPFHANRELRRQWNGYVYLSTTLYVWLFLALVFHLPVLHYDTRIPLSLFSPLLLASVVTLVVCEGVVKLCNRWMVFHVGFRQSSMEVMQNAILVSIACCVVYTQCGTSSSSLLERWHATTAADESNVDRTVNAMCVLLFSGHTNSHSRELPTVLVLWSTAMAMLTLNFAMERLAGVRGLFAEPSESGRRSGGRAKSRSVKFTDSAPLSARPSSEDIPSLSTTAPAVSAQPSPTSSLSLLRSPASSYINRISARMQHELLHPYMLDMVSWYALAATATAVDFLIHLKLFLGRFDMRTLQAALPPTSHYSLPTPVTIHTPLLPSLPHSPASSLRGLNDAGSIGGGMASSHVHRHHLDAPFYYSHLADESELWFDWMSDCGDGFNPSYQVARMLAQPSLRVLLKRRSSHNQLGVLQLPRAKVLFLGGDLAYPSPTIDSYEQRFFGPFQCALPPPVGYDPADISFSKPLGGLDALKRYDGPQCFAIPGNHDWFDGLQTFLRYVCARDWLGGWLLPQEKSYFALKLPHGWWVFALDNALNNDIDPVQFQYFARLAEQEVGEDDRVVLMYHEPDWVINHHERLDICQNIHYLQTILQGKVVLKLAGDLHHYTRHMPAASTATPPTAAASTSAAAASVSTGATPGEAEPLACSSMPSEIDVWRWWNPLSWCRSLIYGRKEYNSRVFLEDVLDDIAPEARSVITLARTQSTPELFSHGESAKDGGEAAAEGEQSPVKRQRKSRRGYSLLDSPPPSPQNSSFSSPQHAAMPRVHVIRPPPRSPSSSPLPPPSSPPLFGHSRLGPSGPMLEWRVDEVGTWLRQVGCGEWCRAFERHEIDGKLLSRLDDDDLAAEVGIDSRLKRKKLLAERDAHVTTARIRRHGRVVEEREDEGEAEGREGRKREVVTEVEQLPSMKQLSPPQAIRQLSDDMTLTHASSQPWKGMEERKEGDPSSMPPLFPAPESPVRAQTEFVPSLAPVSLSDDLSAASSAFRSPSTIAYERVAFSAPNHANRQPPILIVSGGGGAFLHGTHTPSAAPIDVRGDVYTRSTSYPSVSTSRAYALLNIFGFRKRNWRFDIFGGGVYFLLVSSVLPLCQLDAMVEADDWTALVREFVRTVAWVHVRMLEETWLSLAVWLAVWAGLVTMAEEHWPMWKRLVVGTLHFLVHSVAAFSGLVLLELCVEVGLKRHLLGHHDSLLSTFVITIPAAAETIGTLDAYSYGCFTWALNVLSLVFDVPEAMGTLKTKMCAAYPSHLASRLALPDSAPGQAAQVLAARLALGRWQYIAYYLSTGLYLWVLATSLVSFVFGSYLYVMSAFFNAHATPAFSSLRVEGYKNFIRFHLTRRGELEVFVLGMDRCPRRWELDPLWSGRGVGSGECPGEGSESWRWGVPSVWRAVKGEPDGVRLVDYLVLRKEEAKEESSGGLEGTLSDAEMSETS